MGKKKKAKIPKLEIEKFTFSPPGRMGWSYSEYESMMDNPQKVLHESAINDNLVELTAVELMEFPFGQKEEYNWKEEITETSAAMNKYDESAEELSNDIAVSVNDFDMESIESVESYDYAANAGVNSTDEVESVEEVESAEEWEDVEESEEEPAAAEKRPIVIVTMEPPKPPWIASNLQARK
ncbi:hypothetical protein SAMN05877753_101156 [Bacillus oleivorans]|uniref:Uncharacterized protein n=1 Tax=Bacillus oleivorans TaxID=1448271 RepID=A0A285CGY5_9BACI|nr:hypothetical protein [Bacillus oleivorans]SNX66844.1 hypothetical protein SAMN05877753_101156 [Bacillus oleivorans]